MHVASLSEWLSEFAKLIIYSDYQGKMQEVVKAVIYKDDKYLLQLRDDDPTISYPNTWSFFGGGVDVGESHEEALKRELEEELRWCPQELVFLKKDRNETVNCNITFYMVRCETHENKLQLREGQAMGWFTLSEVLSLDNAINEVKNIIKMSEDYLK